MASSSEDEVMDTVADGDDDLFGGDEDDAQAENVRELSDRELDSGDDEGRNDRVPGADAEEIDYESGRDARIMETSVWRHPVPKPLDGQFNSFRLPKFLGIDPLPYEPATFRPPEFDHHTETKSANFSASAVAASTMRYREDASGKLESNTVVYRWSDGSTTISIGDQHYELQSKPLAPPKDSKPYQEVQDSHSYLASPSIASQILVMVGHMTNQYTVRPNKDIQDDALERLQKSLLAATRRGNQDDKVGPEIIVNTQDPELQKKRAEIAEKERMRAQRRREAAAEKASSHKPSGGSRGGLNVDDLEGRRRAPGRKVPRPRNRRADYDSDDDLPRGGRNREDEYDKNDDFLASSDEELEEVADDDDEEELLDEESDREQPKAKKQKISEPEVGSDADAPADLSDDQAPARQQAAEPTGRGRKRNIIDSDDEDE